MTSTLRRCAVHLAAAAVIPPGTVLAARQELARNNGAEPESLDPQLIESTNALNIPIDLIEGLTALDNHAKVVPGVGRPVDGQARGRGAQAARRGRRQARHAAEARVRHERRHE